MTRVFNGGEQQIESQQRTVLIPRGGGVLPYMGYIGMCGPKGYGFSAVLVINTIGYRL